MRSSSAVAEPTVVIGTITAAFLLGLSSLTIPHAPIHTLSSESAGYGMWIDTDPGALSTMRGMSLCVTGANPVTITGVHFKKNNGLHVTRFATREASSGRGLEPGTASQGLAASGFDPSSHLVHARCLQGLSSDPQTELAIEFVAPEANSYDVDELIVEYRDGEEAGTETVYLHLGVCADPARRSPC